MQKLTLAGPTSPDGDTQTISLSESPKYSTLEIVGPWLQASPYGARSTIACPSFSIVSELPGCAPQRLAVVGFSVWTLTSSLELLRTHVFRYRLLRCSTARCSTRIALYRDRQVTSTPLNVWSAIAVWLNSIVGRSRYAQESLGAAPRIILHRHALNPEGLIVRYFVRIGQHDDHHRRPL